MSAPINVMPIQTPRGEIFCDYCHKKPRSPQFSLKEIDATVAFCSLKCMQIYKIKHTLSQKKPIVVVVENSKRDENKKLSQVIPTYTGI